MLRYGLAILFSAALGLTGCDKPKPPEAAAPAVARAPIVTAYDVLRESLATDDLAATQAAAKQVASLGEGALAKFATDVAAATDLDQARRSFGELSREYIALLGAKPDLDPGKTLVAFRCPMAEGYKKWVQFGEPMRNPYMGKRMLECGAKVDLVP
jgi:hypothetical protein